MLLLCHLFVVEFSEWRGGWRPCRSSAPIPHRLPVTREECVCVCVCVCVRAEQRGYFYTWNSAPVLIPALRVPKRHVVSKSAHFLTHKIKPTRAEISHDSHAQLSFGRELQLFFSSHPFVSEKQKSWRSVFSSNRNQRGSHDALSATECCVVFFFFLLSDAFGHTHTHTHTHNCASVPPVVAENAHKTVTLGGIACQEKCSCRGMADSRPKQPPEAHPEHSRGALWGSVSPWLGELYIEYVLTLCGLFFFFFFSSSKAGGLHFEGTGCAARDYRAATRLREKETHLFFRVAFFFFYCCCCCCCCTISSQAWWTFFWMTSFVLYSRLIISRRKCVSGCLVEEMLAQVWHVTCHWWWQPGLG